MIPAAWKSRDPKVWLKRSIKAALAGAYAFWMFLVMLERVMRFFNGVDRAQRRTKRNEGKHLSRA